MTREQLIRKDIDGLMAAAGWSVQCFKAADIHAAKGLALREFAGLHNTANSYDRKQTWTIEVTEGRWWVREVDELIACGKPSRDTFGFKGDSLADSDSLPLPDVITQDILDDPKAALDQFRLIAADLTEGRAGPS